jgi:hypothetical protein
MENKTCGECRYFEVDRIAAKCKKGCVICGDDMPACEYFEMEEPTVFDRITASPEVLAPCLVFHIEKTVQSGELQYNIVSWGSTIIPERTFETEPEAIAATIARLKEVWE